VTDVMNRVLTRGAGVDVQESLGATALWYASDAVQLSKVTLLTSTWCADVELMGGRTRTAPLTQAAQYNDFSSTAAYSVLDHLLKAGANVDAVDGDSSKRTAPMYLAYRLAGRRSSTITDSYKAAWKARMVRLLDHMQNPNIGDRYGQTVMHMLSEDNRALPEIYDVMALLLTRGADVNARNNQGSTALFNAASTLDMAAARLFSTTWCADTDIKGNRDATPLMVACNSITLSTAGGVSTAGRDMCDYLLKRGADVSLTSENDKKRTALMRLSRVATGNNARGWTAEFAAEWKQRMFLLLDVQQNLDYQDQYQMTALHYLSQNVHDDHSVVTDVMNRVLTRGAGVDVQASAGTTALWYATDAASLSHVQLLLTWCADESIKGGNPRRTPLERAEYLEQRHPGVYRPIIDVL